jgi:hypothetical protein
MKHKSIWGLAILVTVFSLLSILVIKNQALAVWSNPGANPPSTVTNTKFVFNPVTANVDLNSKDLNSGAKASFTEVCISGVCNTTWPTGGSGGGDGVDWKINYSVGANRALYYTTTSPASNGNVGIGIDEPVTEFHIHDVSSGPIVSLSGKNSNYRGISLKDTENTNVEKWFYGSNEVNNFVIRRNGTVNGDELTVSAANGNVAIGTNLAPTASKLNIYDDSSAVPVLYVVNDVGTYGGTAIKGVAYGYNGTTYSHGVEGQGKYGVWGRTNNGEGMGIWGEDLLGPGNISSKAAHFKGDVQLEKGNNSGGYLQLTIATAVPISSSCDTADEGGRMIYYNQAFYICAGTGGWQTIAAN